MLIVALSLSGCMERSKEKTYLFEKVPKEISGIDFENNIVEDEMHNILNYIYFYNGGGVAVGDVDNDGLPDIFLVSNQGQNKLYLNRGGLKFEDVTKKAGIGNNSSWNTGVTMVDINADGFLDIYVCSVSGLLDFKGHNELYMNNGNGTFSEKSKDYGLDYKGCSTQAYFFDYDKDDDLDVYLVNHAVHTTLSHGPASTRNQRVPKVGDVLLKNEGGKFINVSEEAGIFGGQNGYGLSASIADFNGDGWEDIYVCNDFHEDDYYYLNNGDGSFREQLANSFPTISRFSMGSDAADVNNDGLIDLMTLDMLPRDERVLKESEGDDAMFNIKRLLDNLGYKDQYSRNMLQINNEGDYFTELGIFNGVADTDWSWGPLFADFDNDGKQDLFVTTGILRRPNNLDFRQYVSSIHGNIHEGNRWLYKAIKQMPSGKYPNQVFRNEGTRFQNKNADWMEDSPSLSNGSAYADLDLDGDLDLVVNELNGTSYILENQIYGSKGIVIQLRYKGENLEGIGSKVELYGNGRLQSKALYRSRGFMSAVDGKLHFGLGTGQKIDSLRIVWPNLESQTLIDPQVENQLMVQYEPSFTKKDADKKKGPQYYFTNSDVIQYNHEEDDFDDFHVERLNHYRVSTQGPSFDVSDIDDNGFQDILIGGSSGKKTVLFMNNGIDFTKRSIPAVEADSLYEDNAVHFFDADSDGDDDLYIASGLNDMGGEFLNDRIYLNNSGVFQKAEFRIPTHGLNTSCVVSYDYDKDGDLDLFVGHLSAKDDFGARVPSFLLKNDGKGNFSIDSTFELSSMVTDAIWVDVNADGWKDLILSVHWDFPKIYINNKGTLSKPEDLNGLNGLWQSVGVFDMDADGDKDIILGNWGLNTKLSLYSKEIKMFHGDFNQDGKSEAILTYPRNGNWYPFNSKDELGAQMKMINKRFTSYKEFAGRTIEEIFVEQELGESTEYQIDELASGYLRNDNGVFKEFVAFGSQLQSAPINCLFAMDIQGDDYLLVGGNLLNVSTYHGGYTSLKGFLVKNEREIESVSSFGIKPFSKEIKGFCEVEMEDGNLLLVFANNGKLETYRFGKE